MSSWHMQIDFVVDWIRLLLRSTLCFPTIYVANQPGARYTFLCSLT